MYQLENNALTWLFSDWSILILVVLTVKMRHRLQMFWRKKIEFLFFQKLLNVNFGVP